jgi:hypothetical protein
MSLWSVMVVSHRVDYQPAWCRVVVGKEYGCGARTVPKGADWRCEEGT